MRRWKIFYSDGSTFSDADGPYHSAPTLGVQVIAQEDPDVGRILLHGFTAYWWLNGGWFGGDRTGEFHYDIRRHVLKYKLFGETIENDQFDLILKTAMTDQYLPLKSAKHPREANS